LNSLGYDMCGCWRVTAELTYKPGCKLTGEKLSCELSKSNSQWGLKSILPIERLTSSWVILAVNQVLQLEQCP
jgi:hypothetical protein